MTSSKEEREAGDKRGMQPLAEILQSFLAELEENKVGPMSRLRDAWSRVVKKKGTAMRLDGVGTRIASLRDGIVVIEVKSPPLCAELSQFWRKELLDRLRAELKETVKVKALRFRLGVWK